MQTSRENIDNYQSELASLDPRNEFVNGQTMTLSGNNQDGSSGLYQWNPAGQINGQGSDNSNPSFLNNPDQQRYVELQQAIVQEQDNCAVLSENNKVTVVEMTQNAKELDDINNNIVTQTDQVATLQTEVTDTGSDVTTDFSQTTSDAGTGAGDSTLNVADAGVNTVKAGVNTVTGGEQQAAAIAASMNMATVSAAPKLESESVANLENGATNAVENGSTVAKGINDALAFTTTAISSVGSLINYSSQIGSMLGTTEQTASDAEEVGSSVNETKSTIDATIVGVGSDNPDLLV